MRNLLTSLVRFVSWHRRAVAATLAAGAVLLLAQAVKAPEATLPVAVLTSDLPAGHELVAEDVAAGALPPGSVPSDAIRAPAETLGRTMTVALSAGTVLQPGMLSGQLATAAGRAVVPIAIADESLRALLRPGDQVSLVAPSPDGLEVLTGDARIVALPKVEEGGSRIAVASGRDSGVVLVEVPSSEAARVASLGQGGEISIVLGHI